MTDASLWLDKLVTGIHRGVYDAQDLLEQVWNWRCDQQTIDIVVLRCVEESLDDAVPATLLAANQLLSNRSEEDRPWRLNSESRLRLQIPFHRGLRQGMSNTKLRSGDILRLLRSIPPENVPLDALQTVVQSLESRGQDIESVGQWQIDVLSHYRQTRETLSAVRRQRTAGHEGAWSYALKSTTSLEGAEPHPAWPELSALIPEDEYSSLPPVVSASAAESFSIAGDDVRAVRAADCVSEAALTRWEIPHLAGLAVVYAVAGDVATALRRAETLLEARTLFGDAGWSWQMTLPCTVVKLVQMIVGSASPAERFTTVRDELRRYTGRDIGGVCSLLVGEGARALAEQGRNDEAIVWTNAAARWAAREDPELEDSHYWSALDIRVVMRLPRVVVPREDWPDGPPSGQKLFPWVEPVTYPTDS